MSHATITEDAPIYVDAPRVHGGPFLTSQTPLPSPGSNNFSEIKIPSPFGADQLLQIMCDPLPPSAINIEGPSSAPITEGPSLAPTFKGPFSAPPADEFASLVQGLMSSLPVFPPASPKDNKSCVERLLMICFFNQEIFFCLPQ